jgi:broad specificity phosphatase PhoE
VGGPLKRLYLLRHGPTEASRAGAPLGALDWPVSAAGEAAWPGVRARLLALGLSRVLTSDLRRARVHAADLGLPCTVLPGLGEQRFGAWEGRPWAEIPDAAAFLADPVHAAPPGGESFAAAAARAIAALEEAGPLEDGTLVLAHAGPLRAILAEALGLPVERALDFAWDPFGLTLLERFEGGRRLVFHNRAG